MHSNEDEVSGIREIGDAAAPGSGRVDELIDVAARAMTRGEPSHLLRASIRERLGRRPSPVVSLWIPTLATAAVLVLAVFAVRSHMTSVEPRSTVGRNAVAPRTPPPVTNAKAAPQIVRTGPPERAERSARAKRSERAERFERPKREEPPIVIDPLETPPIAVDTSSGVMPIEIEPLGIEPLRLQ